MMPTFVLSLKEQDVDLIFPTAAWDFYREGKSILAYQLEPLFGYGS
jgi:hypothetical protein